MKVMNKDRSLSIPQTQGADHIDVLSRTLYGEARGEFMHPKGGLSALIAVGNVVMNRLKSNPEWFGKTVSEVCLKPYQFSCWRAKDVNYAIITSVQLGDHPIFDLCHHVAQKIYYEEWPDLTQGCDHYYASWMTPVPAWAKGLKPKREIGQHLFFKLSSDAKGN